MKKIITIMLVLTVIFGFLNVNANVNKKNNIKKYKKNNIEVVEIGNSEKNKTIEIPEIIKKLILLPKDYKNIANIISNYFYNLKSISSIEVIEIPEIKKEVKKDDAVTSKKVDVNKIKKTTNTVTTKNIDNKNTVADKKNNITQKESLKKKVVQKKVVKTNKISNSTKTSKTTHKFGIVKRNYNLRARLNITNEDIIALQKAIISEAGYQSYTTKLAVANTIINRALSPSFPSSIRGVIYQRGQFYGSNTDRYVKIKPTPSSRKIAMDAISGLNNIDKCLYFNNAPFKFKSESDLYGVTADGERFYY
ncbi:MAG: hypothetical protein CSB15_00795 [Clostridiales bacterium]|nr:MAG: hypothetical protein CSB15_00795 [Clostridiales bacterium]